MTVDQFIAKNNERIADIVKNNRPLLKAVYSIVGDQAIRIFQDGKNSAGGKIGTYNSTKPLYINTRTHAPINNSPKGKTGKSQFKNGKQHKTTYYESYKDFRQKQKREAGFVNLRLINELQSDYSNAKIEKTSTAVPAAKPIKVNQHHYKLEWGKPINAKKAEKHEDHYGPIFRLTKEEKAKFFHLLQMELAQALRGGASA